MLMLKTIFFPLLTVMIVAWTAFSAQTHPVFS
jgi:hypothetical protein